MLKPIRTRPEWDCELLDYVLERVEPDCSSLRAYLELPASFWDLRDVNAIAGRPQTR